MCVPVPCWCLSLPPCGSPWNYVVYCSFPKPGWRGTPTCDKVVDGLAMPNGIATSPDGKYVYVLSSTWLQMMVFRNLGHGKLGLVKTLLTDSLCDNLRVDASGDLFTACHVEGLKFKAHTENRHHVPLAPSQVLYATAADIVAAPHLSNPFETLLLDTGAFLSASAVATHVGGGRTLVGGVFNSTLLDCSFSEEMAMAHSAGSATVRDEL